MPEISFTGLITAIRRLASTPSEAERMMKFLIIEMMLLAVMFGLLDVRYEVQTLPTTSPGDNEERPRTAVILPLLSCTGRQSALTGAL